MDSMKFEFYSKLTMFISSINFLKVSLSTPHISELLVALTVADLGVSCKSAVSPKPSPGVRMEFTFLLLTRTSRLPFIKIK